MKFNEIDDLPEKKYKKVKAIKINTNSDYLSAIDYMARYKSIGVYIMKYGKKGIFRDMASLVNDGVNPTSWALRTYYTDNWYVQFGVNPNAKSEEVYLSELFSSFEERYDNIIVSGNRKMVLLSNVESKKQAEDICNNIINIFEDVELEFEDKTIDDVHNRANGSKPFKINGFFPEKSDASEKFNNIISKLSKIRMSASDTKNYEIIKKKLKNKSQLRDKDKEILNRLMKDYFSTSERISLAMKYLSK